MDLMKELIEERKEPHTEDIGSWRGKAADAAKKLESALNDIRGEDPDSDYYDKTRAMKVTKFLKGYIEKIEKDIEHINTKLGS